MKDILDKRRFGEYNFPFDAFTFNRQGASSTPKLIMDSAWDFEVDGSLIVGTDNESVLLGTGNDAKMYYDGTDLIIDSDVVGSGSCKINSLEIDQNGFIKPISSANASAPNNSIYYSTDSSKLVYKDSGGSVNALY